MAGCPFIYVKVLDAMAGMGLQTPGLLFLFLFHCFPDQLADAEGPPTGAVLFWLVRGQDLLAV